MLGGELLRKGIGFDGGSEKIGIGKEGEVR